MVVRKTSAAPTDPVFNPMWRQGMYTIHAVAVLGVTCSWSMSEIRCMRSCSRYPVYGLDATSGRLNVSDVFAILALPWFRVHLGVLTDLGDVVAGTTAYPSMWIIEAVTVSHFVLTGLLWAAPLLHWVFWDLDVLRDRRTHNLVFDLPKIFGIHLLASADGTSALYHRVARCMPPVAAWT